jgi:hypothetical protein
LFFIKNKYEVSATGEQSYLVFGVLKAALYVWTYRIHIQGTFRYVHCVLVVAGKLGHNGVSYSVIVD